MGLGVCTVRATAAAAVGPGPPAVGPGGEPSAPPWATTAAVRSKGRGAEEADEAEKDEEEAEEAEEEKEEGWLV